MENVNTNVPKNLSRKQKPNTNQTNNQDNNTNQNTDSSEVCHGLVEVNVGFSGVRRHTSFRCDSNLWETFKNVCKKNGLSTCDILEKLILGFCVGYTTRVAQPTTLSVVVDAPRVVKRVRRRQLVFEGEVESSVLESGRFVPFYDLDGGVWRKVRVDNDFDVNVNGHLVGCGCRLCNPKAAVKG